MRIQWVGQTALGDETLEERHLGQTLPEVIAILADALKGLILVKVLMANSTNPDLIE